METKNKNDIVYTEPDDYFPKELREKYKLGEYAEDDGSLLKYRSYYVYDFKWEEIRIADGDEHSKAYRLYEKMAKEHLSPVEGTWALDIALDCIRNMKDEEIKDIATSGEIPDFHFGYGMYVRNKYIHPSKKHPFVIPDIVSSDVKKFIYAIIKQQSN